MNATITTDRVLAHTLVVTNGSHCYSVTLSRPMDMFEIRSRFLNIGRRVDIALSPSGVARIDVVGRRNLPTERFEN
jgi:hypothetical protein